MKYTIQWCEEKQTKVGAKLATTLRDEKGQDLAGVTLWASNWPNYQSLKAGDVVEGEIIQKQNGAFTNITLYPPKSNLGPKPAWAKKDISASVEKAQEVKREDIKTAQERTQEGVKMSGSARDATLILTTFYPQAATMDNNKEDYIKMKWEEWRKWLFTKYDEPFIN